MPERRPHLSHLLVRGRVADSDFHRKASGFSRIRPVEDRVGHGTVLLNDLGDAMASADRERDDHYTEGELRAVGVILRIEGVDPAFPLKLESLESTSQKKDRLPKWLLLSVTTEHDDEPESAIVWVGDEHRREFLERFEQYLHADTPGGSPKNQALVANIARIEQATLRDLWTSDGTPPRHGYAWWEIWLAPGDGSADLLRKYGEDRGLRVSARVLHLRDRIVMRIEAPWDQLLPLPYSSVPISEIRRPEFIETIEDLSIDEQADYVEDLALRLIAADDHAPAVCHLDTGVARTHALLQTSLAETDLHTIIGTSGFDRAGHGTAMAGLALFGDSLDEHLLSRSTVKLRHRLESVRILPVQGEAPHDPMAYGDVTAQAVAVPQVAAERDRVYCMPVSNPSDASRGQPTLWSATVDALAAGAAVTRRDDELQIMSATEAGAARLIVVSTGNVGPGDFKPDPLEVSDLAPVEDPGQSWNALTVGAFTELDEVPQADPHYEAWTALSARGDLSPHSRTSLLFDKNSWPIKPEIVLEGGNVLHDGGDQFESAHPAVSLRTTGTDNTESLISANATSAATAQAARLAALTMSTYPEYWPETVRGMIVHGAQWTPTMQAAVHDAGTAKGARQAMLRRYGWGVPREESVLYSSEQAVTLVIQDEFVPFPGDDFKSPAFRLHDLPWPREVLQAMGAADVELRVTLSYFIEPTASRRGWRQRYSYASHSLRFEIQDPLEDEEQFRRRINHESRTDGDVIDPGGDRVRWLVGTQNRHRGSLHQDVWTTSAAELSASGRIAVYPVGGWWKYNRNRQRLKQSVRYSLIVSLKTAEAGVNLYTPVSNMLYLPIEIPGT